MGQSFSANRPGGECVCGCGGGWERRTPTVNQEAAAELPDEHIASSSSVQRYVSALTERTVPIPSPAVSSPAPVPKPLSPPSECRCNAQQSRCVSQSVSRRARIAWPLRRNVTAARHQGCVCTAYRRVDHEPVEASAALISEVERERDRRLEDREIRLAREAAEQQQTDRQTRQVTPYATAVISRCANCNDDSLHDGRQLHDTHSPWLATVLALRAHELRQELDVLTGLHTRGDGNSSDGGDSSGSTADLFLVSVAPHSELARVDAEDCDESARVRRAIEIAQGVDPPPGYRPHFQVVRALVMKAPSSLAPTAPPPPPPHNDTNTIKHSRVHTQVDYIHCLVPDLRAITACCFYWGKMDRYEAERLLDNKPEGTFLLRDSAQEEHLFSVSFRKYGRSLHARIEHFNHKFSFDSHDPAVFAAKTVTGLIEHYKDPACVMFFEPMLTAPLPRAAPFALQQIARAVIVSKTTYDGIDELPLPNRLKSYLKEYHYRQRVRVSCFDRDISTSRTLLLSTGECLAPNYFTT